jgi:hypothetical protein
MDFTWHKFRLTIFFFVNSMPNDQLLLPNGDGLYECDRVSLEVDLLPNGGWPL